MQRRIRPRIPLFTFGLALLAAAPAVSGTLPPPPIPGPDTEPFCQTADFFNIYLTALHLIDTSLIFRNGLDGPEAIQTLLSDLDDEARFVTTQNLAKEPFAKDFDASPFEHMALPAIFRYKMKYKTLPGDQAVRESIRANPLFNSQVEQIFGWEILVEFDNPSSPTSLQTTLKWIEEKLKTQPFQWVALQYYESIGAEYDGSLGTVTRGQIPDWKFDAFLKADLKSPWFGPVQTPAGYLFGKIHSRRSRSDDPYALYAESVRVSLLNQRFHRDLENYYQIQAKALGLEDYTYDHASSVGLAQIAYRIKSYAPTYRQILDRFPQYTGNPKDPRFYDAMAKHGIDDDLIFFGPDARPTRQSPEYAYLANAYRNSWLVNQYVKRRLAAITPKQAALDAFYEYHKNDLFARPDLVQLLILGKKRDRSADSDPLQRSNPRKPDFLAAQQLRRAFLADPTHEGARRLATLDPTVALSVDPKPVPADSLGRVLELGVQDHPEGYVTPPLVSGDRYLVVKILTRQKQPPAAKEVVQNRLHQEYLLEKKRQILSEIYPPNRAKLFF